MIDLVIGGRYVSRKRPKVKAQLEGVEGAGQYGLVCLHFLRSGSRLRTPLWLFSDTYKRDTTGPLEPEVAQ